MRGLHARTPSASGRTHKIALLLFIPPAHALTPAGFSSSLLSTRGVEEGLIGSISIGGHDDRRRVLQCRSSATQLPVAGGAGAWREGHRRRHRQLRHGRRRRRHLHALLDRHNHWTTQRTYARNPPAVYIYICIDILLQIDTSHRSTTHVLTAAFFIIWLVAFSSGLLIGWLVAVCARGAHLPAEALLRQGLPRQAAHRALPLQDQHALRQP